MPHRLCLSLVRRRLGGWQEIDAVVEDMQMRIEGDPELAPHFEADVHLRGHIRQYTVGSCSTGGPRQYAPRGHKAGYDVRQGFSDTVCLLYPLWLCA